MVFSAVYLNVRCLFRCLMVLPRRQMSRDAELLVLRHENALLRRQIGRVRYQPGDRLWLAALVSADRPASLGRGAGRDPGDAAGLAPAVPR